jgi:hypothetical protein
MTAHTSKKYEKLYCLHNEAFLGEQNSSQEVCDESRAGKIN